MKAVQETSHRTDLGKLEPQTAFQALVAGQQLNVLRTITTDRLEQNQRFDIFGFRATALALLELLELPGLLLMLPIELLLLSVLFLAWRCFFALPLVAVPSVVAVEPELALALLLVLGS